MGLPAAFVALTALSATSSITQGIQQKYIASQNAEIEERNAFMARKAGTEQGRMIRVASAQMVGEQKAALGKAGLDVNSGSAVDLMRSTAIQYELDALKAEYGGEVAAVGHETNAASQRMQGKLALRVGYVGAVTSGFQGYLGYKSATGRGNYLGQGTPSVVTAGSGQENPYSLTVGPRYLGQPSNLKLFPGP